MYDVVKGEKTYHMWKKAYILEDLGGVVHDDDGHTSCDDRAADAHAPAPPHPRWRQAEPAQGNHNMMWGSWECNSRGKAQTVNLEIWLSSTGPKVWSIIGNILLRTETTLHISWQYH